MLSQRQLFLQHVAQTSPAPLGLEIVRAEGVWLYGPQGERYLDLISGISVSNIGHGHPAVKEAVNRQLDQYAHLMVYGEYIQTPQVNYARQLASLLPDPLDSVYFVNSGTEANEAALKLAKRVTGRMEIVGFRNSYHGSTHGTLSLIGDEYFRRNYRPLLPGVRQLRYNVWDDLQHITCNTACVLAETIQAEAGIRPPDAAWMQALRDRCTDVGALLILDEIQTGFGRTGTLFGFTHYGIVPDMVTFAKGMGGGLPIGVMVAPHQLMQAFTEHPVLGHITTFGGNAVCVAAAQAVLDTLLATSWMADAESKAQRLAGQLTHPAIVDIRYKGLMMAVEFADSTTNFRVIQECLKRGVVTDWFLFADQCLRIGPPLLITEAEIDWAAEQIMAAISAVVQPA